VDKSSHKTSIIIIIGYSWLKNYLCDDEISDSSAVIDASDLMFHELSEGNL